MKHLFLALLFLLLTIWAQAQSKTITGILRDAQAEPAVAATIQLFRSLDSSFIKGTSSDLNGKFQLQNLPNDKYYLVITGLMYKKYQSANLTINEQQNQIDLPLIVLLPAKEIQLKEVVVTAKKPLIEQDIDKTIVNVEAMISAATSNTLEVLEKTPGVIVDENGNINLNGKSGVLVLIDGRSTYMSGADLAAYLRSLPGGMLDRIELMDNPPAKYDAEGGAVINIRLKRNRALGLTGNLSSSVSQGQTTRSIHSFHLNYNKAKINWLINLGYGTDANAVEDMMDRELFSTEKTTLSQTHTENFFDQASRGVNARVGLDYNLSSKSILGAQVFLQNRPRENANNYTTETLDPNTNSILYYSGNTQGSYDWLNQGANLNFQHKFNDRGRELTADLNYLRYESTGEILFNNYQDELHDNTFRNLLLSDIDIYNVKADYQHPLKNKALLEAGFKSSSVKNDNNSLFENLENTSYTTDYGRSNHFVYHEKIHAAYASLRKNGKRWGTQLGLRMESTQILGDLLPNEALIGEQFTQNFSNLLPSVYVSYKLDSLGHHTLGLNYNTRLNRPNYQEFNPFLAYVDNYSYTQGNTNLRSAYMTRLDLRYQYQQLLNVSISYNRGKNFLTQAIELLDGQYISRPQNLGKAQMILLAVGLNLKPLKFWSLNANFQTAQIGFAGNVYTENIDKQVLAYKINLTNQFTLPKGWSAELAGNMTSRDFNGQNIVDPRYRVFFGLQKKILKDKGRIKLSAEDLFRTWVFREEAVAIRQTEQLRVNRSDTQRIGLAFTYRFGNEKWGRKRKHQDNAADEEVGRVN